MLERICYYWRLLATGGCFVIFGIGGIVLLVLVFPLLSIFVRNRGHRSAQAKAIIYYAFQLFVGLMSGLGVLRFEIIGRERLNRRGLLILANHPSLIDTVFLMAFVRYADCIVKADLRTNLFTRAAVNTAGYVCNNQGNELISDCIKSIHSGNNLIVFPEGTRTRPDGQICLKRGAANIAVRAKCDITPVIITCEPPTLGKHDKWWHIPPSRVHFRIVVQEDIPCKQFMNESTSSEVIAARHLTTYLQNYFSERTQHGA